MSINNNHKLYPEQKNNRFNIMEKEKTVLNTSRKSLTTWLTFIIGGLLLFVFVMASVFESEKEVPKRELSKSEAWRHAEETAKETIFIISPNARITDISNGLETAIEEEGNFIKVQGWIEYTDKINGDLKTLHKVYQAVLYMDNDSIFYSHFDIDGTPRLGVVTKPPF